jgi:vacuolar-type H+-ATPase subunit H
MTNQERLTSPGPARDDPGLEGTTTYDLASGDPGGPTATDRARDAAATGRDQAQQVASTATDQARDVAATARGEAQQVAQTAQGQARRLVEDTRSELRSQANSQVERLADGLGDLSRQLRSMEERGDPGPATDLAGQAAARTQQVADRLRRGGFDDAVGQLRRFGRNRPGLFLLGAFGVGLAAGRVVRNMADGSTSSPGAGAGAGAPELGAPTPTLGGTYAERYTVPASAGGQPVPPRGAVGATRADYDADASAQRAYGAPDVPVDPPAPPTAPVGEQRRRS